MSARKFTDGQAIKAIQNKENISVRMVLSELSVSKVSGSNYEVIYRIVKRNNLDTSHWLGKSHAIGKAMEHLRVDASKMFGRKNAKSHDLKKRLIRDGYKKEECEICHIDKWQGQKAPLELDHKDGNHQNNTLENLRILCPNCHAIQPTNSGKNKRLKRLNGDVA